MGRVRRGGIETVGGGGGVGFRFLCRAWGAAAVVLMVLEVSFTFAASVGI